jgi:TonB family protein
MNASLLVDNVLAFSLQAGVMILAGLLLLRVLRLARPLAFLQVLLAAVLLLPLLQSPARVAIVAGSVAVGRVAMPAAMLQRIDSDAPVDWAMVVLVMLGIGVTARVGWLILGLARLRGLRRFADVIGEGVAVSTEIAGPVTFGFWRPIILVPPEVSALPAAARDAILAHERAHVRRKDWLFALGEELVLCVLWFHPAVWLLVTQIRLAREQVVDLEACGVAGSREEYVNALLTMADARLQPYFAPAPPFLRRRQLSARIRSLILEVPMSRFRMMSSYFAAAICTLAIAVWVTASFPLRGAPQLVAAPPDYVSVQGAELIFSTPPVYPMAARRAGAAGPVTVEVTLAANGEVADARVVAGPQELRRAALAAVLNWQFKPGGGVARVVIDVRAPAAAAGQYVTKFFFAEGIPAHLEQTLRARLQPFEGSPYSDEIHAVVQGVSRTLKVRAEQNVAGGVSETIVFIGPGLIEAAVPGRIRVSGLVQAANIVSKADPVYPPLARQARIQGTVRFNAIIDRAGAVGAIEVVAGHPLLIPAAQEALRQYRYHVTQLNGQAVEVATQVDVNFVL